MKDPEYASPFKGNCTEQSLVQKSYPLLSLWKSHLSLQELKILDTYLARIDSHQPEKRWVRFEKGELESILGVKQIKINDLKDRLRNLCIVVNLEDPAAPHGFRAVSLFEQILCDQDSNGLWQVDLQCTFAAMQYIFNVDNIGYLKYKLWAVMHLRSRYSYVLFLYVERNSFLKSWEISLEELRQILRCDEEPSYKEFRRFNDRILKRAYQEIIEKTDCRFSYETVRVGRRVKAIRFHCENNSQYLPMISESDKTSRATSGFENSKRLEAIQFLSDACIKNGKPEFNDLEIAQILEILRTIPPRLMPQYTTGGNMLFAMHHYLGERYATMNRLDEEGKIHNRFAYLVRILKQDAGIKN